MANQTYESPSNASTSDAIAAKIDMKFEIVVIPVSDIDRAKKFYRASGGGSTPTTTAVKTSV